MKLIKRTLWGVICTDTKEFSKNIQCAYNSCFVLLQTFRPLWVGFLQLITITYKINSKLIIDWSEFMWWFVSVLYCTENVKPLNKCLKYVILRKLSYSKLFQWHHFWVTIDILKNTAIFQVFFSTYEDKWHISPNFPWKNLKPTDKTMGPKPPPWGKLHIHNTPCSFVFLQLKS